MLQNFYPRLEKPGVEGVDFYPRPPRGGRRVTLRPTSKLHRISIHALREEGDCSRRDYSKRCTDFYPRPPRGGRPEQVERAERAQTISIHALREEGDLYLVG